MDTNGIIQIFTCNSVPPLCQPRLLQMCCKPRCERVGVSGSGGKPCVCLPAPVKGGTGSRAGENYIEQHGSTERERRGKMEWADQVQGGEQDWRCWCAAYPIPSPGLKAQHGSTQTCAGCLAGAGLSRPAGQAATFSGARGQMFPYFE